MIEETMVVQLESPQITGGELAGMALGILVYRGHGSVENYEDRTIYLDVIPDPNDACRPTFTVRVCQTEEEEREIDQLKCLIDKDSIDMGRDALHFKLNPKGDV